MTGGISLFPLVPWPLIAFLGAIGLVLVAISAWRRSRGTVLRALALAVLVLALLNPGVARESRTPQTDIAVIVVDESASQKIGDRKAQAEKALDQARVALARHPDLEVKVVRPGGTALEAGEEGTRLFSALDQALADVPRSRLAGALLITDGQVHDVPRDNARLDIGAPVHVMLTGRRGEKDRRLVLEQVPAFGLVGQNITVGVRVIDQQVEAPAGGRTTAQIVIRRDGIQIHSIQAPIGEAVQASFPLEHAGRSIVELEVEAAGNELSLVNNRIVTGINGVRDRLRVLLISGQPHAGERVWRNLLKADPSVDLVHFTILRPPEKDDLTPLRELALIVFPVQELFEVKIKDFNLIIFDRYMERDILPPAYMRNIERYVREGGALLFAVGPEYAGIRSLFRTPLAPIVPVAPTGEVFEEGFRPAITDVGRRHPVTAALPQSGIDKPAWGRWFRHVDGQVRSGNVLLEGFGGRPLFVVDRVEKGRVAQLMSDHMWLWAREYEGGGPQAEILRRLAHWLMKEPELEEESLSLAAQGNQIVIERRSLDPAVPTVTVTAPSGATEKITLSPTPSGFARATLPVSEIGLFRAEDGSRTALAAVGSASSPELSDLRATTQRLEPLVQATGGGFAWIADDGVPELRRTRPGRDTAGRGWLGLRQNEAYVVTGANRVSLLPGLLVLALAVGSLMGAWWREGR